jgi:hypothetical protein
LYKLPVEHHIWHLTTVERFGYVAYPYVVIITYPWEYVRSRLEIV